VRGRPGLYTSYEAEAALLPTRTRKAALVLLFVVLVLMPFSMPVIDQIPFVRFLGDGPWLRVVNRALIFSIAALGLNLLAGVAGQVSLGHAFFMGVGAYTAVLMGGISTPYLWGWGLPMWLWLPASGVVAAGVGILVAPAAVRVRGLYLAIATIGLVFIGLHLSRVFEEIAGPGALGRKWPKLQLRIWKEEEPFLDFAGNGHWLWFDVNRNQKTYFFLLTLLVLFAVAAANLSRSRTGRSWAAIRDRDVAAEIMGVAEFQGQDHGVCHLVVLRRGGRSPLGFTVRLYVPRGMEPSALRRTHRHSPHRRYGPDIRSPDGVVLRSPLASVSRRIRAVGRRAGRG